MLSALLSNYVDGAAAAKREFRTAVKVGLRRSAIMVANDVKKSMGGNRFGVVEIRIGRGTDFVKDKLTGEIQTTKKGSAKIRFGGYQVTRLRKPSPPGEPPAIQTGTLVRSITTDSSDIEELRVRIGTNIKYGKFLELGTPPYNIWPNTKKALSFSVNYGTTRITVGKVRHPGIKARPFLRPALQRNQGKIDAAWSELVGRFKWKAV